MNEQRSNKLPVDIVSRLREVVAFTGNEKSIDEDPVKIMSMLLYGLQEQLSLNDPVIKYVVRRYCSAEGVKLYSRHLQEKNKVA